MIKEDYTFYYSEKGFAFVKLQTTGEEQYQSKIIYRSMENDQFEMATIPGKFLGIIEEYLLVKAKRKHSWGEERLVNFYNLQYPFKVKEGKDNRLGEFNYAGYEGVRVKDGQLIGVFGVNRYIIKIEEIIKRCPVKKFKVKAVKKEKEKKGGKET